MAGAGKINPPDSIQILFFWPLDLWATGKAQLRDTYFPDGRGDDQVAGSSRILAAVKSFFRDREGAKMLSTWKRPNAGLGIGFCRCGFYVRLGL